MSERGYPEAREARGGPTGSGFGGGRVAETAVRFSGGYSLALFAGEYSCVQLLNPAASAVVVRLTRVWVPMTGNVQVDLRRYDTALTTLAPRGVASILDAATPRAEVRAQTMAAKAGTPFLDAQFPGTTPPDFLRDTPIVMFPGQGMMVLNATVAVMLRANFEWSEQPVDEFLDAGR